MARSWRLVSLLTLMLAVICLTGCSSMAWQHYQESPANPATWVRALFPPEGETFYSDTAQSIDHRLNREVVAP